MLNQLNWIFGTVESIISRNNRLGYSRIFATDLEQGSSRSVAKISKVPSGFYVLQFYEFTAGSKLYTYFPMKLVRKANKNSAHSKHSLFLQQVNMKSSLYQTLLEMNYFAIGALISGKASA